MKGKLTSNQYKCMDLAMLLKRSISLVRCITPLVKYHDSRVSDEPS